MYVSVDVRDVMQALAKLQLANEPQSITNQSRLACKTIERASERTSAGSVASRLALVMARLQSFARSLGLSALGGTPNAATHSKVNGKIELQRLSFHDLIACNRVVHQRVAPAAAVLVVCAPRLRRNGFKLVCARGGDGRCLATGAFACFTRLQLIF